MCLVTHGTLQLFLICYMDKTFKLLCFVLAITICSKCTTFDQLFLRKFIKTDARAGGIKQLLYMHMHYAMHTRCHDLLCMAVFFVCVCVYSLAFEMDELLGMVIDAKFMIPLFDLSWTSNFQLADVGNDLHWLVYNSAAELSCVSRLFLLIL